MLSLGKLYDRAKAAVPKVVNAVKKEAATVEHKVANLMGKIAAAVPNKINAKIKSAQRITQKIAAAIPKKIDAAKNLIKKGATAAAGKAKEMAAELKNERILDKIKAEWEKATTSIVKGTVTSGAIRMNPILGPLGFVDYRELDVMFEKLKAIDEEYPQLNWLSDKIDAGVDWTKHVLTEEGRYLGKGIYDLHIEGISDFVGEFTDVREEGAPTTVASIKGALARGFIVDGAGGLVEGVIHAVAHPFGTLGNMNKIAAYPEVYLPAISSGMKEELVKVMNGSPEDKSAAVGEALAIIASFFAGAGEVNAATKATEAANMAGELVRGTKLVDGMSELTTATKLTGTAAEGTSAAAKVIDMAALKELGRGIVWQLNEQLSGLSGPAADFIDNFMYMFTPKGPEPAFAMAGGGSMGEKIVWKANRVNIKGPVEAKPVTKVAGEGAGGFGGAGVHGTGEILPESNSLPKWLKERFNAGNKFNKDNRPRYPHNEVEVEGLNKNPVVDSYIPGKEIISRKYTQFSEIQEHTAIGYINELDIKYPLGAKITDSPFNANVLRGKTLQGDKILEVPVQNKPIPQKILDMATEKKIIIRDVDGKVYN